MGPLPPRRRKPSFTSAQNPSHQTSYRRHAIRLVALAIIVLLCIYTFSSSKSAELVTDLRFFHHTPAHAPPEQKNSTSDDIRWYSDWKWLNPFSASVTLDDDRVVLPPLSTRLPIYTYYDTYAQKDDEKVRDAETHLLLAWRRAWWAKGFRPIVLGRSDATNNPLYGMMQAKKLSTVLENDLLRWLAWGQMGSGALANWLLLPMGDDDDDFITFLRRGEFPQLTRFQELGSGLLVGVKDDINAAIREVLDSTPDAEARTLYDVAKSTTIAVDSKPASIAFYDTNTIAESYKEVSAKITENRAEGLTALLALITTHLQSTFLSKFNGAFAILTPSPDRAQIVTTAAHALVKALQACPPGNPLPSSCPPNKRSCQSCTSLSKGKISVPSTHLNKSTVFTIGTIPNPYTFASLLSKTRDLTTRHIRRDTQRDRWLGAITKKTLGSALGGPSRLVNFKETVGSERGLCTGLWILDDPCPTKKDLEFHFGFELAGFNASAATVQLAPSRKLWSFPDFISRTENDPDSLDISPTDTPEDSDQQNDKHKDKEREKNLWHQTKILVAGQKVVQVAEKLRHHAAPGTEGQRLGDPKAAAKEMVEAWNLADTEAWRFVRALRMRERVQLRKWEEEERRFAGGDGARGSSWRWFD